MIEQLPTNPFMLVSAVNTLLRDGEFESLEDLCAYYDQDTDAFRQELQENGFEYDEGQKQFR